MMQCDSEGNICKIIWGLHLKQQTDNTTAIRTFQNSKVAVNYYTEVLAED